MPTSARAIPLVFVVLGLLVSAGAAHAVEVHDDRARALYVEGKDAFERGRFDDAYARFRDAYLLSRMPALLYNMASALEKLQRPHDAAEALRAYLLGRPADPDQAPIESRIRALEEAQRWIDAERLKREPPKLLEFHEAPRASSRRRTTAIVVGTVAGVLVVGAVAVGLGFGLRHTIPDTELGNWRATP